MSLDLAVGVVDKGRPQVWFLPDGFASGDKARYTEPAEALLEKFETNTRCICKDTRRVWLRITRYRGLNCGE
jgi:hypothetical protein